MRLKRDLLRPFLTIVLLCAAVQGAAAWGMQDSAVNPSGGIVPPGATVTASCTVHFGAGIGTGNTTFDPSHTLVLGTDLSDARWTATLVNINKNRAPITTPLSAKSGSVYRIDGGALSYANGDLNLIVTLHGTAPAVPVPQQKEIISIQELDDHSEAVTGAFSDVTSLIAIPSVQTTVQPPAPDSATVAAGSLPTAAIAGGTATPAIKQTYSYGPDPVATSLLLVLVGFLLRRGGKRHP